MKIKKNKGQGLIEMVVAIAVLVSVATGLLVAVTVAIKNVSFARRKSEATSCTEEAIEQVRHERQERVWNDGTENDFYTFFVGKTKGLTNVFSWEDPPITEGNDGEFTREVKFEDLNLSGLVTVTAVCRWTDGSGQHESRVVTYFSNWK